MGTTSCAYLQLLHAETIRAKFETAQRLEIQVGARFHGQVTTTDYMEAAVLGDGRISARQSLVVVAAHLRIEHRQRA